MTRQFDLIQKGKVKVRRLRGKVQVEGHVEGGGRCHVEGHPTA
ncbi:uncharacterized protein G2W53_025897 [Senna tora]|uniref:Uncharacterized protein n=1 Tax=Senna tora TaxID=362788 RepID=A0A834TFY6_9FABA|nr:uncharacterized protein G2W53_025897 [Senna tora]